MTSSSEPPRLATNLLQWFVPVELRDVLLGDLREEHLRLAHQNPQEANNWYWKQTMNTSIHYMTRYLASEDLLRKLIILVALVLMPCLLMAVFWLSQVDNASDYVWQNILQGKVHLIVLTKEFWYTSTNALVAYAGPGVISMYINVPSVLWALFTFLILYWRDRLNDFSAHQAAAWGMSLMFLPYLFGLFYIEFNDLNPKQIGPIIAIMLLSIVYILVPLAWFVVKKTRS